jgi:hypothetical protein
MENGKWKMINIKVANIPAFPLFSQDIFHLSFSICHFPFRSLYGFWGSAIFCVLFSAACASSEAPRASAVEKGTRFVEGFVKTGEVEGGELHRKMRVNRRGRQESSLVLAAPIIARAEIREASAAVKLQFLAAPVFNLGDGFQLDVFLKDGSEKTPVYSRYFDAGRKASDRDWIPIEISLNLAQRKQAGLELRISAGPQGDLVADWLALAQMRMIGQDDPKR